MENILFILTYIAVSASAISGALEARKNEMDIVGAMTIAFVTAFGGGTIRDLLLGRTPIFWVVDPLFSIVTFFVAFITFYRFNNFPTHLLNVPDAIGLSVFSILGATYAMQLNLSGIVAILMGVITGIFGGVLRDLLCNRVPNVFRHSTELYATCSFIGTGIFILLIWLQINPFIASVVGGFVILSLRLLSVQFKITLPKP
ncbi:MAG: trimeric intracellular cation channel family protein [Anaerolineales bacterium]|nr:trimeric intracellular cation channel family protein [Anaerolineales bacterium]